MRGAIDPTSPSPSLARRVWPAESHAPIGAATATGPTLACMTARRFVYPQAGDDLAAIAARELPDVDGADQQLLSWNLHLAARRTIGILPSDIVFTEPPPAR